MLAERKSRICSNDNTPVAEIERSSMQFGHKGEHKKPPAPEEEEGVSVESCHPIVALKSQ